MKALIYIVLILVAFVLLFFLTGLKSRAGQPPGLTNGELTQCSSKPNCVCSEYEQDQKHYINAIHYSQNDADTIETLQQIIGELGGTIQLIENNYIAATFKSSVFGFVDDLELRLDTEHQLVHLRSASRVGYSDRGVNRKRLEVFVKRFAEKMRT